MSQNDRGKKGAEGSPKEQRNSARQISLQWFSHTKPSYFGRKRNDKEQYAAPLGIFYHLPIHPN